MADQDSGKFASKEVPHRLALWSHQQNSEYMSRPGAASQRCSRQMLSANTSQTPRPHHTALPGESELALLSISTARHSTAEPHLLRTCTEGHAAVTRWDCRIGR